MRVISGKARGITLNAPKNDDIRPSLDRYKEDVFNIMNLKVYDARFLDIFAGTGAIGIEALSRGAKQVCFVDNNEKSINIIKSNLKKTKLIENNLILQYDYKRALEKLNGQVFDIVYLDPPFNKNLELECIKEVIYRELLSEDGSIVCESSIDTDLSAVTELGLDIYKVKKYKYCKFTFMRLS